MISLASYKILQSFTVLDPNRVSKVPLCRNKKVRETKHDLAQWHSWKAVLLFTQTGHETWRNKTWQSGKGSCGHLSLTLRVMLPAAAPSLNTHLYLLWLCLLFTSGSPERPHLGVALPAVDKPSCILMLA